MEGEIEAETQKTTVVGVEEYVGQCDRWLRTYRSVGRCLVLRIHKDQLRFVLNKRIPKLKLVYHPETVGEHLSLKSD